MDSSRGLPGKWPALACNCRSPSVGAAEVVLLLGYIGTVFLYRLIFIRFYAAANEEVQARALQEEEAEDVLSKML